MSPRVGREGMERRTEPGPEDGLCLVLEREQMKSIPLCRAD